MSGAGNDFVVLDYNQNQNLKINQSLIKKICDRRFGIGADGLITIENSLEYDFVMNYYNADGSSGSLCANGARCAIRFASDSGMITENEAVFYSNDVQYKGQILSNKEVKLFLRPPNKIKYNFKIKALGKFLNAHFADTGSPHVIIDIKENKEILKSLEAISIDEYGKEIRYLPEFTPEGTNVNFIEVIKDEIYIRTYERGVEAETLACGTGSVAAALICYVNYKLQVPIKIIPKSKEKLFVNFEIENSRVRNLSLTGPAEIIFTGEMKI